MARNQCLVPLIPRRAGLYLGRSLAPVGACARPSPSSPSSPSPPSLSLSPLSPPSLASLSPLAPSPPRARTSRFHSRWPRLPSRWARLAARQTRRLRPPQPPCSLRQSTSHRPVAYARESAHANQHRSAEHLRDGGSPYRQREMQQCMK
eukprot:2739402-Rhodomonas_salina.3